MVQINATEMLIFGGENIHSYKDISSAYIAYYDETLGNMTLRSTQNLPRALTPESPSYSLNSNANFYFMDNMSHVYKYQKSNGTWDQIEFKMDVF